MHISFLFQHPPLPLLPEGFMLVYKAGWGWDGVQRDEGQGEGGAKSTGRGGSGRHWTEPSVRGQKTMNLY